MSNNSSLLPLILPPFPILYRICSKINKLGSSPRLSALPSSGGYDRPLDDLEEDLDVLIDLLLELLPAYPANIFDDLVVLRLVDREAL